MSQCFKLVNAGFVDKVIVFDSLPERLYKNVQTRAADGFPKAWARWLGEIGSTRTVFKTETSVDLARNWTYKHTPIGKEPCFFVLQYQDLNADKEMWRNISEFIRMNAGQEVRLKEKIEDMAISLAGSSTQPLELETEDVPVIPLPVEKVIEPKLHELVKPGETILIKETAPKKRGRPAKKIAAEV